MARSGGRPAPHKRVRDAVARSPRSRKASIDPFALVGLGAALGQCDQEQDIARLTATAVTSALSVQLGAVVLRSEEVPEGKVFGQLGGAPLQPALAQEIEGLLASSPAGADTFAAESRTEIDVEEEALLPLAHAGLRRLLVVRLGTVEESFGSVIAGKRSGEPFVPEERAILETLAGQASMALHRVQTEKALRETALFAELNPAPVLRFDEKGVVLSANPAAVAILGREAKEGAPLASLLPNMANIDLARTIREGLVIVQEAMIGQRHFQFAIRGVPDLGVGHVYGSDISERKRAEEALRQAEEKYRSIFEHAVEGIFQSTPEGQYLSVNPAFALMYGYESPEELLAAITDIEHQVYVEPGRRAEFIRLMKEHGAVSGFESQMYRKDGSVMWISENARAVRDDSGALRYYEGAVEDITEHKRADAALHVLNKRLEEANRHKSEFLANLSHELRTPLNAILGASELLAEGLFGPLNEKQTEYVRDIHEGGTHLLSLINDVLDLSKVEAGRLDLHLSHFDLRSLMESSAAIVRERAASKSLEFNVIPPPEEVVVEADQRKIKQIVYNLLSNAVKFTPEKGRVVFRALGDGEEVIFAVEDTGPGVAEEFRERIFEEFFQAPNSREGTGLGLALSKRLVELHRGRIWLESQVGQGSRFFFAIPIAREAPTGSGDLGTTQ